MRRSEGPGVKNLSWQCMRMQILLQKKGGLKLNSVTTMYYVSPCCFVFLLIPWMFLEYPKLSAGNLQMALPCSAVFCIACRCWLDDKISRAY